MKSDLSDFSESWRFEVEIDGLAQKCKFVNPYLQNMHNICTRNVNLPILLDTNSKTV